MFPLTYLIKIEGGGGGGETVKAAEGGGWGYGLYYCQAPDSRWRLGGIQTPPPINIELGMIGNNNGVGTKVDIDLYNI